MKNWLIRILGGKTTEEVEEVVTKWRKYSSWLENLAQQAGVVVVAEGVRRDQEFRKPVILKGASLYGCTFKDGAIAYVPPESDNNTIMYCVWDRRAEVSLCD